MAQQGEYAYPVTLKGELTEPLNRWLFLIKWLLVLPHLVVLLFLFIGFIFSWLFSFFAILFTGRYPRGAFDYNVGVLRWIWRMGFYSYQALGTDKYPPFTLASVPGYPADLTVEYPERLSRGLVLVKWWLLAIPHYIVTAAFEGGQCGGLTSALALFGAVGNLFNRKYPADIFGLVIGFNRWVYRVIAYASLMTDKYPPFRLGE